MSDEEAIRLVQSNPGELAAIIVSGNLDPVDLSYVSEIFGDRCVDTELVLHTLSEVLHHERSYVREGALYGLASHLGSPKVQLLVERVLDEDSSMSVREIAGGMLERLN